MHQFSELQIKVPWSAIILKIVIFIRICMVNGQGLPVQLICHTKPYNNRNFQIDGASWYFGVWVWQLVHLLTLVCSFQWCVLFLSLAKLYRSCPIRDKGLLSEELKASLLDKRSRWVDSTDSPTAAIWVITVLLFQSCKRSLNGCAWPVKWKILMSVLRRHCLCY